MPAEIKTETIDLNGKSVLLVSVKNGEGLIGTCTAGHADHSGNRSNDTRLFYIGSEPIIDFICPSYGNKNADKLVSFCPGFQGYDRKVYEIITGCLNRLNNGDSLAVGLHDIFSMLQDGIYKLYVSDYYPTDGNGVFFWGGYNISHEIRGTAEYNRTIGLDKVYKPCFLIPTQSLDYYNTKVLVHTQEQVQGRRIEGIVYHLSGFHSALLKGHHGAVCCVEKDVPFKCAVIEKITEPYTEIAVPVKKAAPAENASEEEKPAETPAPAAVTEHEGITGFRSPSVKIPLEAFPKDMLRLLIGGRPEYKPPHFATLNAKLGTVRRKSISNNILPLPVLEKAEQMPDCSMVESAYAIKSLSDEELNCLLAGDVECNGEVIVSPNFYASIVTACNFLQFTDTARFVDFAIAIMENPELGATHDYVSRRVCALETNKKLYNFFKSVVDSGDVKYEKIIAAARTFVERFEKSL
ncbi:MAG: hypothetical protein ACI4JT_05720 [Oscillospiraceae bacterium]|nr:hypothetical protein [[Eubacterium] saphenum]